VPEDPAYATVGGFALDQLGFIPKGGESFEYGNHRFTVMEMDGKRVARVKIQRMRPAADNKKSVAPAEAAGREPKVSKAT
jgi:putative hemolysin